MLRRSTSAGLSIGCVWMSLALAAPVVDSSPGKPEKDAAAIVRLLEARYHSASTLKAAFLERYSQGARDMRVESGTAYFRKPGRMRWEYEEPEKKLFVADGKTVWFYVPADRTVTRAAMKESDDWRTPLALLTGKAKLNRLCGRIELVERPAGQNAPAASISDQLELATLRCLPRQKGGPSAGSANGGREVDAITQSAPFEEILLQVNRVTGDLADVVIRQAGGVELEYRFGNWQRGLALADSMFRFVAPPGVAIVNEPSGSPPGF